LIGGSKARGGGVFYAGLGEWMISAWWSVRDDDLWVSTKIFRELSAAMEAVERWLSRRTRKGAR